MNKNNDNDPNSKPKIRFNQEQFDLLSECIKEDNEIIREKYGFVCEENADGIVKQILHDLDELKLKLKGSDRWNKWREDNPEKDIELEGVIFHKFFNTHAFNNRSPAKAFELTTINDPSYNDDNYQDINYRTLSSINPYHSILFIGYDFGTRQNIREILNDETTNKKNRGPLHNNAYLNNSVFPKTIFIKCNFSGAYLNNTKYMYSRIIDSNFFFLRFFSQFHNAEFIGTKLFKSDFKGSDISNTNYKKTDITDCQFDNAKIKSTDFFKANLKGISFSNSNLNVVNFSDTIFNDVNFNGSSIKQTTFPMALDSKPNFRDCEFYDNNKFDLDFVNQSKFSATVRDMLKYQLRKEEWERWYEKHSWQARLVKPFWIISDYGISTIRLLISFALISFLFAAIYFANGIVYTTSCTHALQEAGKSCPGDHGMFDNLITHDGQDLPGATNFLRSIYFSVVTMTTLGFGDIAVKPTSWLGHICVIIQVVIGYFMLGAIVTRFGVAFQSEGPPNSDLYIRTEGKKDKFKYWAMLVLYTSLIIIVASIALTAIIGILE